MVCNNKLILESHVILYVFWMVWKVEVICQCTEYKNKRRSQGVACRCHRVIFFKWGTFGNLGSAKLFVSFNCINNACWSLYVICSYFPVVHSIVVDCLHRGATIEENISGYELCPSSSRFIFILIWVGVNTICRRSWYIAAHVWKIYDFKIEVVPLVINFSTELTTVVKFEV
jgi:hypothetical protein